MEHKHTTTSDQNQAYHSSLSAEVINMAINMSELSKNQFAFYDTNFAAINLMHQPTLQRKLFSLGLNFTI